MPVATRPPSRPIRVLVVDDSVVARRVVARAFETDPAFEVVGSAANGRLALEKITRVRPDVVILDLEMPEMDGFEVLRALRDRHPELPVVVFSHMSAAGASATLDALALGAVGFATKPSADATALNGQHVRDELVPLIRALVEPSADHVPARPPTAPVAVPSVAPARRGPALRRAEALVVGVSTGGPTALSTILRGLPADLAAPVLMVQHMPAVFTTRLAERLDRICPLPVTEAAAGEPILPGRVYLAPGGLHMAVDRSPDGVVIDIHDGPRENSCRPAADVLFRSAARVYGDRLLALVLTGMGQDGLQGAEVVHAAGGSVLAQDRESAVIASMPGAVADAGLADAVVPLDRIADELGRRLLREGPA